MVHQPAGFLMRFALSMPPPVRAQDAIDAARAAEAAGLRSLWLYDAHRLWADPYLVLALVSQATRRLHFGVCVTNPVTRSPAVTAFLGATLARMSNDRFELGIGRGDLSVREMGEKPASLSALASAVATFRAEVAGVGQTWRPAAAVPVWIAAYGPRALRLAGAVADGVIVQVADPGFVRWARGHVAEGAKTAGRAPHAVATMCAAPLAIGTDPAALRARTAWFTRMIAPDMASIVTANPASLPALADWAARWQAADGDARTHIASELDGVVTLSGSSAVCSDRLAALAAEGVDELNVFSMEGFEAALSDLALLKR